LENYESRSEDDVMKDEPIYDKVYLIRYRTPSAKKQVLTRNKFDAPTQKLSSLHVVKLTIIYPRDTNAKHGNINGDGASRAKHTTNVFTFDKDNVQMSLLLTRTTIMEIGITLKAISLKSKKWIWILSKKGFM